MTTPVVTLKQYWLKNYNTNTMAALQSGSQPFTCTPGATLLAVWSSYDGVAIMPPPRDSTGSYTVPSGSAVWNNANITLAMGIIPNAVGGSHTTIPEIINNGTNGSNGEFGLWIFEVTNMPANAVIRYAGGADVTSTSSSWSQVSDGTPQVGDIVIAVTSYENSAASVSAGLSDPPSGWTHLLVDQDATNMVPTSGAYQIVTTPGAQTVSWSNTDAATTEHLVSMLVLGTSPTALVVSSAPQSTSTTKGGFATFNVTATGGTGTVHYQWQVNGVNVGTDSSTLVYQAGRTDFLSTVNVLVTDDNGTVHPVAPATLRVFNSPMKRTRKRPLNSSDNDGISLFAKDLFSSGQFDPSQISLPTTGGVNASLTATEASDSITATTAVLVKTSLSATEAGDTISSTTSAIAGASLSATEAADTVSSTSAVAIQATASITEAADTLSSAIAVLDTGSESTTEAADTVSSATAVTVQATTSLTEAADALSSAVAVLDSGNESVTEAPDILSASTSVLVQTTLSATEAADTISASAGAGVVNASLSTTEADDAVSGTSTVLVTATAILSEASDTVSSASTAPVDASVSVTEANDSLAATTAVAVQAALNSTEADDFASSGISVLVQTTLTATEANDVLSATAGAPAALLNLNVTEAADAISAAALVLVGASLGATEAADTASSGTQVLVQASASILEASDALAAGATAPVDASASLTESGDTLTAQVSGPGINVSLTATEAADAVTSTTVTPVAASASVTEAGDFASGLASVLVAFNAAVIEAPDGFISNSVVLVTTSVAGNEDNDSPSGSLSVQVTVNLDDTEHDDHLTSVIQTIVDQALIYIDPGLQDYSQGDLTYIDRSLTFGTP